MSSIISSKAVSAIFVGFCVAGLSTVAMADYKNSVKDAIAKEGKLTEIKPNEIKSEMKTSDRLAKAPSDADFKRLDGNSDDKLSLKEAVKDKNLAMQFDASDINHDGMISNEEYANYKAASAIKSTEPVAPAALPATPPAVTPPATSGF